MVSEKRSRTQCQTTFQSLRGSAGMGKLVDGAPPPSANGRRPWESWLPTTQNLTNMHNLIGTYFLLMKPPSLTWVHSRTEQRHTHKLLFFWKSQTEVLIYWTLRAEPASVWTRSASHFLTLYSTVTDEARVAKALSNAHAPKKSTYHAENQQKTRDEQKKTSHKEIFLIIFSYF